MLLTSQTYQHGHLSTFVMRVTLWAHEVYDYMHWIDIKAGLSKHSHMSTCTHSHVHTWRGITRNKTPPQWYNYAVVIG